MQPLQAPGITKAFQDFVTNTLANTTPRGKFAVAGFVHPDDIDFLRKLDKTPVSAEIAVQDRLMLGKKTDGSADDTGVLSESEWMVLPVGLSDPRAVLYDNDTGSLLYVLGSQDNEKSEMLVVQMDFVTKKPKRRINLVSTVFKMNQLALKNEARYQLIRGQMKK